MWERSFLESLNPKIETSVCSLLGCLARVVELSHSRKWFRLLAVPKGSRRLAGGGTTGTMRHSCSRPDSNATYLLCANSVVLCASVVKILIASRTEAMIKDLQTRTNIVVDKTPEKTARSYSHKDNVLCGAQIGL